MFRSSECDRHFRYFENRIDTNLAVGSTLVTAATVLVHLLSARVRSHVRCCNLNLLSA